MLAWNAAADGGLGGVQEGDAHRAGSFSVCVILSPVGAGRGSAFVQGLRFSCVDGQSGSMTRFTLPFTVAIDGPAAAGKGTIGRALAARFGFLHLDTGMLYRAVAARVLRGDAPEAAARSLTSADMAAPGLRRPEVAEAASLVAALPAVRAALVTFQRDFARRPGGAILDGRDIGTVICPGAEVKLYVTASAEVRAHRRWLEDGGEEAAVLQAVRARDARDTGRAEAPLRPAKDAVVIDTSEMTIGQAVALAEGLVSDKRGGHDEN